MLAKMRKNGIIKGNIKSVAKKYEVKNGESVFR